MAESYEVILLAAGSARRFNHPDKINKILMPLVDRPVFDYSFRLFKEDEDCLKIWFVVNQANQGFIKDHLNNMYGTVPDKVEWVTGGRQRQDSVSNALVRMSEKENRKVVIHDAARPFVTRELLDKLFQAANDPDAVTLGIPAKDSMKVVRDKKVLHSLYRPEVWHIQTPQLFNGKILKRAMNLAERDNFYGNEEAELIERAGYPVRVVLGSDYNFKLTTAFDYQVAKMFKETGSSTS